MSAHSDMAVARLCGLRAYPHTCFVCRTEVRQASEGASACATCGLVVCAACGADATRRPHASAPGAVCSGGIATCLPALVSLPTRDGFRDLALGLLREEDGFAQAAEELFADA